MPLAVRLDEPACTDELRPHRPRIGRAPRQELRWATNGRARGQSPAPGSANEPILGSAAAAVPQIDRRRVGFESPPTAPLAAAHAGDHAPPPSDRAADLVGRAGFRAPAGV